MSRGLRLALWLGLPFALYLAALASLNALSPWRPAFDDAFHIQDGIRWMHAGRLDGDGLFLRVPLWPMLLGTSFSAFGPRAGLVVLQASIVFASIVCFLLYTEAWKRDPVPASWVLALPLLVFVLSPQIVLYSRHAVNELWIGLLAMGVMLLGERLGAKRALLMGAVVAAAGMTKVIAFALLAPACCYLVASGLARTRLMVLFLTGFASVMIPLLALHWVQHGTWLLDNTAAYQLSAFTLGEWRSLGDAEARYAAGLASGWELFRSDWLGYLLGFLGRAGLWWVRPSSADYASFFASYPHTLIRVADSSIFATMGVLAGLGTTRRSAPIWLFVAAVWLASTFPVHTPYTPKLMLLFPWLLLAPGGGLTLQAWWRTRSRAGAVKAGSEGRPR